jgi:hypothetical protein
MSHLFINPRIVCGGSFHKPVLKTLSLVLKCAEIRLLIVIRLEAKPAR